MVSRRCENCGKTKKVSEFPKCSLRDDGYEIWCRSCKKENLINLDIFKNYLEMNGISFSKENWQSSFEWAKDRELKRFPNHKDLPENFNEMVERTTIVRYQQRMYIGKYKATKISNNIKNKNKIGKKNKNKFIITEEMLERWGYDLEPEEYEYIENVYQEFISNYKSDTPVQRMIYQDIAKTRYEADRARKEGNLSLYEKLMKVISNLMNDANIKPVQETGADNESLGTWGQWVKKIEEEEPIPEPLEEFKDVDNIRKYIDKWFVGHFKRILGVDNVEKVDLNKLMEEYLSNKEEGGNDRDSELSS